ncbi:MAG: ABC transporter permease [Planctomycetota bacterium]|jgi:ABC-type transport system involved in multi-copper enzyme maturation permease subunit
MFRTLVGKEIVETVLGLRFTIVTLLCLVLIPLGMYVNRKDYEHRLASYQRELQTYTQRYSTPPPPLTGGEEAQGFRPPSVLSIFASGLDPFMPDKVFTSQSGLFRTVKEAGIDNPQSLLFGKADFLFNVMFIISLAALIFTFNSISGEREKGTLRLMIAHAIPRSRILLSKIVGKYIVLLVPFMVSVLIALLILETSPDVSIGSPEVWPVLLVILVATGLFIFGMVSLGICISTFTSHSMGSIVLLFFVWAMFILGVPRMSPMIAESIYPVESGSVFSFRKRMVRDDIEKEFEHVKKETIDPKRRKELDILQEMEMKASKELDARVRAQGREPSLADFKGDADFQKQSKELRKKRREIEARYEPDIEHLFNECQRRIASELNRIEQDYRNRRNIQFSIAMNLARISPVSCYAYIVSGLSGTGVTEPDNFVSNARMFQEDINQIFYDKVFYMFGRQKLTEGFNVFDPLSFTDMRYRYLNLTEALQVHWPDILLLCLFNALFCAVALMRFNRYDVR